MAKLKTTPRSTQVKLMKRDSALVYNKGVGIHTLISPYSMALIEKSRNGEPIPQNVDTNDLIFAELFLTFLELSEKYNATIDYKSSPNDFS